MEAYPLHWPTEYPRTHRPKEARFKTTMGDARDGLLDELRQMEATEPILSTNIPLRRDGLPYAQWERRQITDLGVAVYFQFQGEPRVLCCDKWNRIEDNLQALRKTVEAMRGIDRWGVSDMLNRMFAGFVAIPETAGGLGWWDILDLERTPIPTPEQVEQAFREKALIYHPDKGGDPDQWNRLETARQQALSITSS